MTEPSDIAKRAAEKIRIAALLRGDYSLPDSDAADIVEAEIAELQAEIERLRACLTTPEIYAGIISDEMEKHLGELMVANRELQVENERLREEWKERSSLVELLRRRLLNSRDVRGEGQEFGD